MWWPITSLPGSSPSIGQKKPPGKPLIIVIQGDPAAARGISAITALVANHLGIARCLVCLDDHIADYHSANADRENVVLELRYYRNGPATRQDMQTDLPHHVEAAIDEQLARKNRQREARGKPSLAEYFRPFRAASGGYKGGMRRFMRRDYGYSYFCRNLRILSHQFFYRGPGIKARECR